MSTPQTVTSVSQELSKKAHLTQGKLGGLAEEIKRDKESIKVLVKRMKKQKGNRDQKKKNTNITKVLLKSIFQRSPSKVSGKHCSHNGKQCRICSQKDLDMNFNSYTNMTLEKFLISQISQLKNIEKQFYDYGEKVSNCLCIVPEMSRLSNIPRHCCFCHVAGFYY